MGPDNGNFWCTSFSTFSCPITVWTKIGQIPQTIQYTNVLGTGFTTGNLYIRDFGFNSGCYMLMYYAARHFQTEMLNDFHFIQYNHSQRITIYHNVWLSHEAPDPDPYYAQSIGTHQLNDQDPINGFSNTETFFIIYFTIDGPDPILSIDISADVPNFTGTTYGGRIIIHRISDVSFPFVQT